MNKLIQATGNDRSQLAADAHARMATTTDGAGAKVGAVRQRLAGTVEHSKAVYGRVRDKAVEGAKATDVAVHQHPYQAIGVGVGVSALIRYAVSRRRQGALP